MQKTSKRVLAVVLALVMALSVFSISAAAAYNPDYQSTTHTVFKHTEQTLAPGVDYYVNYCYANDGEQNVYFVATADISRDDVVVQTSYMDQYRNGTLGMSKLTDQVASANQYYSDPTSPQFISEYYNVVAGCNASFFNMTTGQPTGVCFIDGVDFGTNAYPAFFAILKDGTAVIDDRGNKGNYDIWQAVGGSQWIVRNGQDVTGSVSGDYNTDRHCRSSVGVTADGKVVIMSLDGRQSPYSIGGSMHEIAQIMLEAGCVAAINLDGGGSTTFVAREEGTDSVKIVDRPSDGSERAISAGLIIASTAAPSNVFDHATLTAENEYISANASTTISAKGISPAGTSADIPAEATFTTTNGTISADGVLTPATVGDAVVQLVYNNEVVGETTVHVVVPDSIEFSVATLAAPYGQDADITMIAKYGEFNFVVKCDVSDYSFALSDAKYGTVEGFVFHATDDTTVTGMGEITATFIGSDKTATIPVTVGKGSEVLFDFESDVDNHQTSRWSGYDGYNAGIVTTCTPVTAANGKVHSGDYAMAYDMDFSQLTYYEDYTYSLMCYNWDDIATHGFTYDNDGIKQRGAEEDFVDITGATGLGMWMYIPDEVDVRGLDVRYTIGGKKTPSSNYERVNSAMGIFFPYRDGLGTDGWYYYYFDLSNYSSWACLRLQNCRTSNSINKNGKASELYGDVMQLYVNDRAWKDADKQFKSYTSHVTLYIDDITVDYSSVVPDREAPVFSNPTYAFKGASDAIALNDGASIAADEIEFNVTVAENTTKTNATGLDVASIKGYVDGVEVDATYKNGKVSIPETTFAAGAHTVTFEAADNSGNTSHITRKFTVTAGTDRDTIKVVPRDAALTSTFVGSLYYIDIVATDVSKVDTVSATLKVNNVNDWELEGLEAADGFTVSAEISNFDKGLVDVTVTSLGNVNLAGEAVIASIPVRTWYPHNALGKDSNWIITQKKCVYPMDTQVFTKAGSVIFTDGTTSTFGAADIQCDSEAMCEYGYIGVNKGNEGGTNVVTSWHEHNAQPLEDKAPTCTEAGYSGRTFCAECNSVIDWGTVIPATGHNFAMTKKGTHFVINGDGWQTVDIDFTGAKGYYITGEENGKKTVNTWDSDDFEENTIIFTWNGSEVPKVYSWVDGMDGAVAWPGTAMTYAGDNDYGEKQYKFTFEEQPELLMCTGCGELFTGEFTDGKYYVEGVPAQGWIDNKYYVDGDFVTGIVEIDGVYYEFNENGESLGVYTGLVQDNEGVYHFSKLGVLTGGWAEIDDEWYYFDEATLAPVAEKTFTYPNSKAVTTYQFEENGKIIDGVWVELALGTRYYYGPDYYHLVAQQGNVKWVEIDGNLYGFSKDGYRHEGLTYIKESNNPGRYDVFSDDGVFQGHYTGILNGYYYTEGYKDNSGMGLTIIDGNYYYIQKSGKLDVSTSRYLNAEMTKGYVTPGTYEFDEEGKMILKNGIVDGFYYEDGSLVKGKGVILYNGDYYFVKQNGAIYTDASLYIAEAKTNNLVPAGMYYFNADGSIIFKNGIVDGCYYVDGVLAKGAGLIKIDNDYYYVKKNGQIDISTSRYFNEEMCKGMIAPGLYYFDDAGKMIIKNGVVDGFYYVNGNLVKGAGVVEWNGDLYFVKVNGSVYKDSSLYIGAAKANGLVDPGLYYFDADGKMILD